MKKQPNCPLILSVLIPLAVGSLSALLSGNMTKYLFLNKPPLSPPAIVFPIVWTILYILMGISAYLINTSQNPCKTNALKIYALQLFFNFCWSILFFRFSLYFIAALWLAVLIILILVMIKQFFFIKPLAAYLQIPYLIWCIFALYLNVSIYILNR